MCGIAGYLRAHNLTAGDEAILSGMRRAIAHRGPDGEGVWLDSEAGIALGHLRLAIVDLTDAGAQPMASPSGRFVLAFNGEVYNHLELRADLPGVVWRGHSDTESLAAAIEAWGLERALTRCVGMFAIAVWDRQERTLALARDRLGEKPLYCGWQGGTFMFGSELKALRTHPDFRGALNTRAVALLLEYGYIPAPHSIHEGIEKLLPGRILTLRADGHEERTAYWRLRDTIEAGARAPFQGSETEARDELEALLMRSVREQSIADVPLGAFLSGGIDSSTIVALMQSGASRPVKTFTIGFSEAEYNEAGHAKAVAAHLGTEHTELYMTPAEAMDVVPRLPQLYDEPFGDSSAIPTFLVSQLARRHVTVSLSGDAGDELFSGYGRYSSIAALAGRFSGVPGVVRRATGGAVAALSPDLVTALLEPLRPRGQRPVGHQVRRFAEALAAPGGDGLYRAMLAQWTPPRGAISEPLGLDLPAAGHPAGGSFVERMMAIDMLTYLPDDILCKVDRAAMAVSLETRVPMLDHRVVAFAWQLPYRFKVSDGIAKRVLRDVLYKYVPRELIERPKMGFGVPIDHWLRGPLRGWAEELLTPQALAADGLLDAKLIRECWEQHLSGRYNWRDPLWAVLMFQAWRREHL